MPATNGSYAVSMACNLCGAQEPEWIKEYREQADWSSRFRVVKCGKCDLVYTDPRPSDDQLLVRSPAYQEMRRQMKRDLEASLIGRLGIKMMKNARKPPVNGPGKVLDIGCSWGDYLGRLRTLGWEPYGIELDEEAAQAARDSYQVQVTVGTAEDKLRDYSDDSFDLVTLWHVLEHLNDPSLVLRESCRVLKPGGMLALEVPNFDSAWSHLLGEDWFPLELPFHLFHFSPRTLRRMLSKAGFGVTRIAGEPGPAQTVWSLHMVWNRMRGTMWNGRLLWSPTGTLLLYPIEIITAQLGRSNHMQAFAVKAA